MWLTIMVLVAEVNQLTLTLPQMWLTIMVLVAEVNQLTLTLPQMWLTIMVLVAEVNQLTYSAHGEVYLIQLDVIVSSTNTTENIIESGVKHHYFYFTNSITL
jgi:hypothetical protein